MTYLDRVTDLENTAKDAIDCLMAQAREIEVLTNLLEAERQAKKKALEYGWDQGFDQGEQYKTPRVDGFPRQRPENPYKQ